jgi:hypothetical protein
MQMADFEWWRCRDKYRLFGTRADGFTLVSESDRFERYRPLETRGLFQIFAKDTKASAEGMKRFSDLFGLPMGVQGIPGIRAGVASHKDKPSFESVSVDILLTHQRMLRGAIDLFERGNKSELVRRWNLSDETALVRPELRVTQEGRLDLVFAPPDLMQAMWLQFALYACSEAKLFRCARCKQPFIVGSGTGRRSTSKWCSNACKVAAFKERKAQP